MKHQYLWQEKKDGDLFLLYKSLGWQQYLQIDRESLKKSMQNSLFVLYVYDDQKLIGTGRVISDGIINAYICGIGVKEDYRNRGIGSEILNRLVNECEKNKLHIQLLCEEELISYYTAKGFTVFATGMKK